MRLYPRAVHKGTERRLVLNEQEEYEAGLEGFERHRNPEVNAREKGTDKEVLRVNPELEKHRLEEEKAKQFSADLIDVAKKAIEEDKKVKITDVIPEIQKKVIEEDKENSFQPHNGDNMLNRTEKKKPGRKPKVKDGSDS